MKEEEQENRGEKRGTKRGKKEGKGERKVERGRKGKIWIKREQEKRKGKK